MKRTIAFTAVLLIASMGADGPMGSMCGMGMGTGTDTDSETDAPDGGMADGGGTPDGGAGMPDGGGMGGSAGKTPHLVNAETGEDLGYLVDLSTLTVFHERANALIKYSAFYTLLETTHIFYPESDCKGMPLMMGASPQALIRNSASRFGPKGTYLQDVGPRLRDAVVKSELRPLNTNYDGRTICMNVPARIVNNELVEFVDTGVKRRPPDDKLRVELR